MYTDIKLEKSMYSVAGRSFTQVLAELDPDRQYKGTELEGLDAYERQLKRFGIKVRGKGCDSVERFFSTSDSAVLFPEYVRREIRAGFDGASLLGEIAAASSLTDSYDYRALSVTVTGSEAGVEQLAELPQTTVKLASTATALTKFARRADCSFEAVRKQRIEAFGVILRTLGAQIARAINSSAISALLSSASGSTYSGSITYAALAAFWASMNAFDMDVMLCSPDTMAAILALDEMKYCVTDFMSSGKVVTPYGVTIIKASSLASGTILGIDSKCAAEAVYGSDIVIDTDRLISTQCDEVTASILCGVSVLTSAAVKKLTKAS